MPSLPIPLIGSLILGFLLTFGVSRLTYREKPA